MFPDFENDIQYGHNLGVYAQGTILYYRVDYVNALMPGSQGVINFGAITGVNSVAKAVQTILQIDENHLLRMRMMPIDDCEVQLWEPGPNGLKAEKNIQSRADRFTRWNDPSFKSTEFYVLGMQRDIQVAVFNPRVNTLPSSRVKFWGYHYYLTALPAKPAGPVRWLPAQGLGY